MNILFLTMNPFTGINMHNIYSDLMIEFVKQGHRPYIVTPREKQSGEKTELFNYDTYSILKVKIGNTSNVSFIEKGISTILLEHLFNSAISKYLGNLQFGLILYSTPPITFAGTIKKIKKSFGAKTYLMLKDIFPQNAVDLGLFKSGSLIYRYFRKKEEKLYLLSDRIGCMSQANVDFLLSHNTDIDPSKVEILPNAIIPHTDIDIEGSKRFVRSEYNIPAKATVFLYGGNFGKPQDIPFVVECMKANVDKSDRYFIFCGTGSKLVYLQRFQEEYKPNNVIIINGLPKEKYDKLARGCDVGMIFLDHRFSIPNFPSRILSYMENSMPVVSCTDKHTDIGEISQKNGFGYWCESIDVAAFTSMIDEMCRSNIAAMGKKGRAYLETHYHSKECSSIILNLCL